MGPAGVLGQAEFRWAVGVRPDTAERRPWQQGFTPHRCARAHRRVLAPDRRLRPRLAQGLGRPAPADARGREARRHYPCEGRPPLARRHGSPRAHHRRLGAQRGAAPQLVVAARPAPRARGGGRPLVVDASADGHVGGRVPAVGDTHWGPYEPDDAVGQHEGPRWLGQRADDGVGRGQLGRHARPVQRRKHVAGIPRPFARLPDEQSELGREHARHRRGGAGEGIDVGAH
mmetsp:Transcript_26469/g.76421  ORF Transcript_26469/g.76421 Transcript_26469/m.76421 type:complete len:230 (+) Transcript_26469:1639-2328(+)